jgi:alginate O-acetyltransferase complex protein AlgJ
VFPRSPIKLVIGLIAVAFFFTPAVAWLLGERAKPIENRPLAAFPSLDKGFEIFDPLTQWTNDHLPLRATAVRANTRLSRRLFDELPARADEAGPIGVGQAGHVGGAVNTQGTGAADEFGRAVTGRNGWLYLSDDFIYACRPLLRIEEVVQGLRRLDAIIRDSGRRLVVVSPPDKTAFEPANLPDSWPGLDCIAPAYRARVRALRGLASNGVVDLAAPLADQQRRQKSPIYLPDDSHWSQMGALVYAQVIARAVDPSLLSGTRIVSTGRQTYTGDLARVTGDPRPNTQDGVRIVRPGVGPAQPTVTHIYPGGDLQRWRNRSAPGGSRLFPGRTVVLGDSFASVWGGTASLTNYFADLTQAPELYPANTVHRLPEAEDVLIEQIKSSRVFVYEQAERQLWGVRIASIVRPEFLDKLERALRRP